MQQEEDALIHNAAIYRNKQTLVSMDIRVRKNKRQQTRAYASYLIEQKKYGKKIYRRTKEKKCPDLWAGDWCDALEQTMKIIAEPERTKGRLQS